MTQKIVTTFVLVIFLLLAFAFLGAFSTYFETLNNQFGQVSSILRFI